jgi:hypothetical protein
MGKHLDLTGQRFGHLTVLDKAGTTPAGKTIWHCRCSCGNETSVPAGALRTGNTVSCGCYRRELARMRNFAHGHTVERKPSPEYSSWKAMKGRCFDPNDANYRYYGGRGITVCERWLAFPNFLHDMGLRPEGKTLDRFDNDKDYRPSNCRWATPAQQSRNRRWSKK